MSVQSGIMGTATAKGADGFFPCRTSLNQNLRNDPPHVFNQIEHLGQSAASYGISKIGTQIAGDYDQQGFLCQGGAEMAIKLRILAVDDHRDSLNFLGHFLHDEGHEVFLARNVATALRVGSENSIDFLISDLRFPDGDGKELLTRLRQTHPTLIGIALSGASADCDGQVSGDMGFCMHLRKPIDLDALRKAITTCARRIFASPPNDNAMPSGSSFA